MNKPIIWALIAGVATGLSLPFLVRPAKPGPTAAVVSPHKSKSAKPVSVAPTVVASRENTTARLVAEPIQPTTPMVPKRARRGRRSSRSLDRNMMRRLQDQDRSAWRAADRMLELERGRV